MLPLFSLTDSINLRADMLMSLLRKEREMGITPDPAVDAYLKARPPASCLITNSCELSVQ